MFAVKILKYSPEEGFDIGPAVLTCIKPEHLVFYQANSKFASKSFGVFRIKRSEGERDFWKFGHMVFWFYDQEEEAMFEAANLGKVKYQ